MTPYGTIRLSISDEITDDSVTFEGQFSYTNVTEITLDITAELTYDQTTTLFLVRYGYDIAVGYSFFGVTFYHMYAEAYIDSDYNLVSIDIYTNIPAVRTKATSLTIVDNSTVELTSYYSVAGVFESKAYIYSNEEYGYSYKVNDALGFDPKTYFNVFTQDTMILSYEEKNERMTSKYYLSGLDGWTEVYYLIDIIGLNNDLDSSIVLDDSSIFLITEDDFDNNTDIGYIIYIEDAKLYYYSEEEDDIEEYVYEFETFYIYQDTDNGSLNPFELPTSVTPVIDLNMEATYQNLVSEFEDYEVLGILIFSVSGFSFEIPLDME